jgi:hypothetical protein
VIEGQALPELRLDQEAIENHFERHAHAS